MTSRICSARWNHSIDLTHRVRVRGKCGAPSNDDDRHEGCLATSHYPTPGNNDIHPVTSSYTLLNYYLLRYSLNAILASPTHNEA